MAEQKLNSAQVPSLAVDQRCFGAAHGVRAVLFYRQANTFDPFADQTRILPCREVVFAPVSAWKKPLVLGEFRFGDPSSDGLS